MSDEKEFQERLERLRLGYPLSFKRTKPRSPEKKEYMIRLLLRATPPPEEILSGKAFFKKRARRDSNPRPGD